LSRWRSGAAADDASLAGAGAGEIATGRRRDDGFPLLRVEVVEQAIWLESGHGPRLAGAAHRRLTEE
jgi:hypothetical protein